MVVTGYGGPSADGKARWVTICDCGRQTTKQGSYLRKGRTKSCGCLRGESIKLPLGVSSRNSILHSYKKHASERGLDWALTDQAFDDMTKRPCFYCGLSPSNEYAKPDSNGSFVYSGIDRLNSLRGYTSENTVACCTVCNRAKMALPCQDFLAWVDRVYHHQHKSGAANA